MKTARQTDKVSRHPTPKWTVWMARQVAGQSVYTTWGNVWTFPDRKYRHFCLDRQKFWNLGRQSRPPDRIHQASLRKIAKWIV